MTPRKGFTLIETMVAITLLAVALIGPFVAVQNAVQSSYVARDQLIASQLAQEGMEYVRSVRDTNYLSGNTWMHYLSSYSCYGATPGNYCTVDPTRGHITQSGAMAAHNATSAAPFLYLSSTNLYNQQSSGNQTRFKRLLRIYVVSATEVRVWVNVQWRTSGKTYSIDVFDNMHNWI